MQRRRSSDAAKETVPYYIDPGTKKEQASKEITIKAGAQYVTDVKAEFVAVIAVGQVLADPGTEGAGSGNQHQVIC